MLDVAYRDTVTLRRPKPGTRKATGEVELEEVLDTDGTQLPIRCRLEERGRRFTDSRGTEIRGDAQLFFRIQTKPTVAEDDIVVDQLGRAWKVLNLEVTKALFGNIKVGRADLQKSHLPVPGDKHLYG